MCSDIVAKFTNVTKYFSLGETQITALSSLDLDVKKGSFTFITGPSGSGKTTALNLLGAIDIPDQGSVTVLGQNLAEFTDNDLTDFRGNNIGYIFQNFNLIPVLSVYENVDYPLALIHMPEAKRHIAVSEILEAVGLGDRATHRPNELSGGQRQRVAIARALVKKPAIVLADEPTANLDSKTGAEITDLMLSVQRDFNTTFVFSSHDSELISRADDVFQLIDGTLAEKIKEG